MLNAFVNTFFPHFLPLVIELATMQESLIEREDVSAERKRIGRRIQQARERLEISSDDFARKMGRTGRPWTFSVENGETSLKAEEISLVCKILQQPADWILGISKLDPTYEHEVLEIARGVPSDVHAEVLDGFRSLARGYARLKMEAQARAAETKAPYSRRAKSKQSGPSSQQTSR